MMLKLLSLLVCVTATSWGYRFRRLSYLPDPTSTKSFENCPMVSGPTIPQKMDSDNLGVEKLVVYLYKKRNTQEIVAHIPFAVYQNCIPDFPREAGIVYNNFGENTVKKVFDSDSITVLFKDRPGDKLNNGNDNLNSAYLNSVEYGPSWQLPLQHIDLPIKIDLNEQPNLQYNPAKVVSSEAYKNVGNDDNVSANPTHTVFVQLHEEAASESYSDYNKYPDTNKPSTSDKYETHRPQDALGDYLHLTPGKDSTEHLESEGEPQQNPTIIYNSQKVKIPHIDDKEKVSGWKWETMNLPLQKTKSVEWSYLNNQKNSLDWLHNRIPKSIAMYHQKLSRNVSFDYWLLNQLNNIKETGVKIHLTAGDIHNTKQAITDALKVNGLKMYYDGILVDDEGIVSSLDNLVLQPLMMVKSLNYNHLHKDVVDYEKSGSAPFQSLFVTLLSPRKILGVIPIRVLPSKGRKLQTKRIRKTLLRRRKPKLSYRQMIERQPDLEYADNTIGDEMPGFRAIGGSSAVGTGTPLANRGRSGFVREDPISVYRILSHIRPIVSYRQMSESEPFLKDISSNADVVPGFRIIGGSSAVGSGTPLASRGRSGLEDGDLNSGYGVSSYTRPEVSYRQMSESKPFLENNSNTIDVVPSFRIIGGSSAAGSGARLSNRGRSGLEEEDPMSENGVPSHIRPEFFYKQMTESEPYFENVNFDSSDGEVPDFRIIGGSSAGSSGTPLASRGSSGFGERDLVSAYKLSHYGWPQFSSNQLKEREPTETVYDRADDEVPGFRVVGGSSATGSGSPLASRGRSGPEETDPITAREYLTEESPYFENFNITDDDERPGFRIIGGSFAIFTGTPLSNRGRDGFGGDDTVTLEEN